MTIYRIVLLNQENIFIMAFHAKYINMKNDWEYCFEFGVCVLQN